MKALSVILLSLSLTACATPQTSEAPMSQNSPLTRALLDTLPMMSRGDADSVGSHYATDATYVNAAGGVLRGADAIAGFVRAAGGVDVQGMCHGDIAVQERGDAAYTRTSFAFSMKPPSAPERISLQGTRLTVWARTDAGWRISVDVWEPAAPKAQAPCE